MSFRFVLATVCVLGCRGLAAAEYYCDPSHGNSTSSGTAAAPWGALAEAIAAGRLKRLKGGDSVLLRNGNHGSVSLGGENSAVVTIAAAPDHQPHLSRLEIPHGRHWHIKGLTISPSFGPAYKGPIVQVGEGGESSEIVIEDCFVYGELDSSGWDVEKWKQARTGMNLGRHGTGLVARNNYILNTRFGLTLSGPECVAEANVIVNFSADGLRMTRDGQQALSNVIRNVYCSSRDGDDNHDDGIQCFLFNVGTGTVRKIELRGNIIINREDDNQKWPAPLQAIGFFDGPLIDFVVDKNVILTNHSHGVSLYNAQNCLVQDNACYSRWDRGGKPWVMLGSKRNVGPVTGNTVKNNLAHSFNFRADPGVVADNNETVTKDRFYTRFRERAAEINQKYGEIHPVAKLPRVNVPAE